MTDVCHSHIYAIETTRGSYVWKKDATYRLVVSRPAGLCAIVLMFDLAGYFLPSLQLYRKDDMSNHVAHLQQGTRTQNFAVIMQPEAQLIRDDVIISFLILEQRLRVSEKNVNVGGGKFEQNRTLLGHTL
jgi:hypothetical protein